MTLLIVGIAVFFGLHLLPSISGLRERSFWCGLHPLLMGAVPLPRRGK